MRLQAKALEGRLFYKSSFSIYGGVAGLYDYGPPGTAVKANLTQLWRQHFVFSEGMLELECPSVTPEVVLKTSGHVDRFIDFSVQDEGGNCIRADHLLEDHLESVMADPKAAEDQKKVLLLTIPCHTCFLATSVNYHVAPFAELKIHAESRGSTVRRRGDGLCCTDQSAQGLECAVQ